MSNLLEMRGICKSFSGIKTLSNVQLEVKTGEVHALLGENGAGKSTLMKILAGIYKKDEGTIIINGQKVNITDVESSRKCGISIIHQELMLIPHLSIAENIFLGREERNKAGIVKLNSMMQKAQRMLDDFDLNLRADTLMEKLNVAEQQMIEIVRAVSFGTKLIVMDEPTSSLSRNEVQILFRTIRNLKEKGVAIIYISHRLSELYEIADRVTVLRDGQYITTLVVKETAQKELIKLMVGRELGDYYTKTSTAKDEVILKVENLSDSKVVKQVDFNLRRGEILGFAGLVGAGRSETMGCLFGLRKITSGNIFIEDKKVDIRNPRDAINLGIGMVPEDRKLLGIFPNQNIRFNTTLEVLNKFLMYGYYNKKKEKELTDEYVKIMQTKISGQNQLISSLSGGNQQKIIISRWLLATNKILILDEPTRGVDVKTKAEIYHIINELAIKGLSIIMVSSELPELINMCDRIIVISHGYTSGILDKDEFSQEKIMEYATKEMNLV